MRRLVWRRVDRPGMEIAHVESLERASGTQIGVAYELRWGLDGTGLELEVVGGRRLTVDLGDADFFSIVIPAGPHALLFDIEAYDVGSSADLTIYLYDPDMTPLPLGCKANCAGDPSCTPCAFRGGISGVELDPFGEYESFGAEIVLIHVKEAGDKRSPANWYTLSIGLEER